MKIIGLLILILGKYNISFSEEINTDSVKTYDYWAKRGIIEVVYAYMNDYIETVSDSSLPKDSIKDTRKEEVGRKEYENKFIKPLGSLNHEELSSKLNEVSSFLTSNDWSGANNNILQPLMSNLIDRKTLNKDFFNNRKPSGTEYSTHIPGYKNKNINWSQKVEEIIIKYNEDIKRNYPKTNLIIIQDDKNLTSSKIESKPSSNTSKVYIFSVISGILSFFIGFFLCYQIVKTRIYKVFANDLGKYLNSTSHKGLFSYLSIIGILKSRKEHHKKEEEILKNKVVKLEFKLLHKSNQINKLPKQNRNATKAIHKTDIPEKPIECDIQKEDEKISVLYFSIPESDGRFIIEKGELADDGTKYYKIEHKGNSDEGRLFFLCGRQDKRAINRLDSYLRPVCEIDNINYSDNASKIELVNHGLVIKISDSWVIDTNKKVKIKFT